MLSRSVVPVLLCQSEVDEEQLVTVTADSHEEVVGFNVSVDEVFIMDIPREQIVELVKYKRKIINYLTRFCRSSGLQA